MHNQSVVNLRASKLGVYGSTHALIAILLFSLTVPMTSLALQAFSAEMIASVRALTAGLCSLVVVLALGWRRPNRTEWVYLAMAGLGVCVVFPYSLALSLNHWDAGSMGVALAAIPLITALMGCFLFQEQHTTRFWWSVACGTIMLMLFAWIEGGAEVKWQVLIPLIAASFGYGFGGKASKTLGGWPTICWLSIAYLPFSIFACVYIASMNQSVYLGDWYTSPVYSLVYLALVSQWLGFYFWYDAMAKIGIAKAGQFQLLQPFFTLMFSIPLLGAVLEWHQLLFAILICGSVLMATQSR